MGKNSRTTTAKERMLKNIRHALLQKKENPFPGFEEAPLFEVPTGPLSILFAEEFSEAGGQFIYCEDEFQLIENLLLLAQKKKFNKIYAWEKSIQDFLMHYEFPFFHSDTNFDQAEVGISACEALIARTGSILISSRTEAGRRLSSYSPAHIVFARADQVVLDIKDGLSLIQERYSKSAQLPSFQSLITGQSEVYVFLLES